MNSELVKTSKFLSYVLRHAPEAIGLHLDPQGWANVQDLIECAAQHGTRLSHELILATIAQNDKQRFTWNDAKTHIRANQGHSISVDLQLLPQAPPDTLYHGTAQRFITSIQAQGLIAGSRQHVHLSQTSDTAIKVGQRHGKPVVLKIKAQSMYESGHEFFCSKNGVWLTEAVPTDYISFPSLESESHTHRVAP